MAMTATAFFDGPPGTVPPSAEDAFFGSIKIGNNTFKLTATGRFADLDEWLLTNLPTASTGATDDLLDIGISSGITTLELHERLVRAGRRPRITATDLAIDAYIVRAMPGCLALVDREGHVLQYELLGLALRPWRRRLDMVDGMVLVRGAVNAIFRGRLARMMQDGPPPSARPVKLVSPRLARADGIRVVQDDILVRNPDFQGRFGLVRAVNILNRHYFSSSDMRRAVANVASYMSGPGACLLVGRTQADASHDASLFRMDEAGQFILADRYGAGSEVEDYVLGATG